MLMRALHLALFLMLVSFAVSGVQASGEAPDFQLKDIHGKAFRLSDFRGKVILLEFFATSCGPCVPQMDELRGIRAAYSEEQLKIISISIDPQVDTDEVLGDLARNVSATWILARDTIDVRDEYGAGIAPTIYLIDQKGTIRYRSPGLTKTEALTPNIDELISEFRSQPASISNPDSGSLEIILLLAIAALVVVGIFALRRRKPSRK